MSKYLVVGSGFSGAVIANLISENLNEEVTVIDRKNHIGGNCYDYRDNNNIMIHKYGPHAFHTNSEKVWNYVTKFSKFNNYEHKVKVHIDGKNTVIPFNFNTLYDVYPSDKAQRIENKLLGLFKLNTKVPIMEFKQQDDEELKELAEFIYEKIFLHYTIKQWNLSPEELDSSVMSRVPILLSRDNRYFQDKYQGIPVNGYTELIKNILACDKIKVMLETDFKDINSERYDKIFYTGAIDEYYGYEFGELPYRSVFFKLEEHNTDYYQEATSINYPNNHNYTRVHEYKYFLNDKSEKTTIAKEFSEQFEKGKNERCYPVPRKENQMIYNKYLNKAKKESKNIYFLGRLGDYKYYNMDQAILRAIEVFEEVFNIEI